MGFLYKNNKEISNIFKKRCFPLLHNLNAWLLLLLSPRKSLHKASVVGQNSYSFPNRQKMINSIYQLRDECNHWRALSALVIILIFAPLVHSKSLSFLYKFASKSLFRFITLQKFACLTVLKNMLSCCVVGYSSKFLKHHLAKQGQINLRMPFVIVFMISNKSSTFETICENKAGYTANTNHRRLISGETREL